MNFSFRGKKRLEISINLWGLLMCSYIVFCSPSVALFPWTLAREGPLLDAEKAGAGIRSEVVRLVGLVIPLAFAKQKIITKPCKNKKSLHS